MSDTVRIRSGELGDRAEMPKLLYAKKENDIYRGSEIAFRTDTEEMYIGTREGNKRLCGVNDLAMIQELQATINSLSVVIEDIAARLGKLEKPSE